jgi:5-(carboxyamino)imidazole ribonucleotide synthase
VRQFVQSVDIVTFEFENIPIAVLDLLEEEFADKCRPNISAIRIFQDRLLEKEFLECCGIPVAPYKAINNVAEIREFILNGDTKQGAIVKTRRSGYDGKGQIRISAEDLILDHSKITDQCTTLLQNSPCIIEKIVSFDEELSVIAGCSLDNPPVQYPLIKNYHQDGILRESCPDCSLEQYVPQAKEIIAKIAKSLNYIGVLTVEFFLTSSGLIANEVAPRVHNSGHWTIEGAHTSQFNQAVRAAAGLPLGSPEIIGYPWMGNIIGSAPSKSKILSIPKTVLHLYGKEPRSARKLGHVTAVSSTLDERELIRNKVLSILNN